jgi:uncharacterized lipoprotein YddW (UPF0748 family)
MRAAWLIPLVFLSGCAGHHYCGPTSDPALCPPTIAREFRAAWVATVENIDWPSKPGLSTAEQQREMLAILDKANELKLNAIVLQVRTSCDSMYPSSYEPWSYYLTGRQATPPNPYYDPLEMWVKEAHRRGIELHAWFNPFRAKPPNAKYDLAANHIAKAQANLVKSYGSVMWLDPGEPAAQDLTMRVMMDVVRRYDVDGIHIDDYFYPYQEKDAAGRIMDFPDDESWKRYQDSGGKLSRGDWRRENINHLVHRMYTETKRLKPWVKVGISPFGIWKPGYPSMVKGFNQYESIYADAKLWLNEGWCDYFTPQLYWKTTAPAQPFEALLQWWIGQSAKGRPIWPGLFTSRIEKQVASVEATKIVVNNPSTPPARISWSPPDITDQIEVTRRTSKASGHVHFSMITLMQDRQKVNEALAPLYAEPALVPAMPWLGGKAPSAPRFSVNVDSLGLEVAWGKGGLFERTPRAWIVQVKYEKGWKPATFAADQRHARFGADPTLGTPLAASVSAVDRLGNQSRAMEAATR